MKIGIDISQIVYEGSGIATYTSRLVKGLIKSTDDNQFVLFGSSLRQKKILELYLEKLPKNTSGKYIHYHLYFWKLYGIGSIRLILKN